MTREHLEESFMNEIRNAVVKHKLYGMNAAHMIGLLEFLKLGLAMSEFQAAVVEVLNHEKDTL